MENLRGLGFNWTEKTIEYSIGLKNNDKIDLSNIDLPDSFKNPQFKEILLPENGWKICKGETKLLSKIYEQIYLDGPLDFEIETFTENGECQIEFIRRKK